MTYLKREDRRAAIVEAAMEIAAEQGLAAITARAVAVKSGTALGQIHHHFSSTGELRALAFASMMQGFMGESKARDRSTLSRDNQLISLLRDDGEHDATEIRLWVDAVALAEKDEDMRRAVSSAIVLWHGWLAEIVAEGQEAGEFADSVSADAAAWHFLLMTFGLGSITSLGLSKLPIKREEHLSLAIRSVLHKPE